MPNPQFLATNSKLLALLNDNPAVFPQRDAATSPPIWIMRQAGRYLPEYRAVRANHPDFISFCLTPEDATEVTLQPIRRYDFDAAIIFSDILMIPYAMGQRVKFVSGEGPVLGELPAKLSNNDEHIKQQLAPVYEAIANCRAKLPAAKAMIGFAGAPWTIACYMIECKAGKKGFPKAKAQIWQNNEHMEQILVKLEQAIIVHLMAQIEAGADVVKIFDSWAGLLPLAYLERYSVAPLRRIAAAIRAKYPQIPVIIFPRGVGQNIAMYNDDVFAGIAIDEQMDVDYAKSVIGCNIALQGNIDNMLLAYGGKSEIADAVARVRQKMQGRKWVCNLGHGVLPETPPENMAYLIEAIRM